MQEHPCNLRCLGFTNECFNVLVNEVADEISEARVIRDHSWEHAEALGVVGIDHRVGVGQGFSSGHLDRWGFSWRKWQRNWLVCRRVSTWWVPLISTFIVLPWPVVDGRMLDLVAIEPLQLTVDLRMSNDRDDLRNQLEQIWSE